MEKHGETIAEAERCCCVQESQRLLEEQLPTASQEDQNSRRISRKVCGRFAEAPRKLRGRVAPCLQASAHIVRVAQWSPSLHRLRRNTTFLPYLEWLSFCANTRSSKSCKHAPRKVAEANNETHVRRKFAEGTSWPAARMQNGPLKLE